MPPDAEMFQGRRDYIWDLLPHSSLGVQEALVIWGLEGWWEAGLYRMSSFGTALLDFLMLESGKCNGKTYS